MRERANYGAIRGFCVVRCLACACVRYVGWAQKAERSPSPQSLRASSSRAEEQFKNMAETDRCKRCKQNSRARILSRAEELRAFFIKKMCSQLISESFIGNFSFTPFTLGFIY